MILWMILCMCLGKMAQNAYTSWSETLQVFIWKSSTPLISSPFPPNSLDINFICIIGRIGCRHTFVGHLVKEWLVSRRGQGQSMLIALNLHFHTPHFKEKSEKIANIFTPLEFGHIYSTYNHSSPCSFTNRTLWLNTDPYQPFLINLLKNNQVF